MRRLAPLVLLLAGVAAAYALSAGTAPRTVPAPAPLAAWLSVEPGARIHLVRPAAVWALPLALAPYLVLVARRTLLDARGLQVALQVGLRLLVLAALGLAAAEPSHERPARGRTVVAAFDLSASMGEAGLARATAIRDELLQAAAAENDAAGDREDGVTVRLVGYAATARALAGDAGDAPLAPAQDAAGGSDHAAALRLAEGLLDADRAPRIVLVTDGRAGASERDDLERVLADLSARRIPVHVRVVTGPAVADAAVVGVEAPLAPRTGETIHAVVSVYATASGTARLRLLRNGAPNPLEPAREVVLRAGTTKVAIPVRITQPGLGRLRAVLEPAGANPVPNAVVENDAAETVYDAQRRPRVLLAARDPSRALARALAADGIEVETRPVGRFPEDAAGFAAYDAVILSDVPAARLGPQRGRALADYVTDAGGGLVMIGGEHTFGPGGFGGTALDEVLPVRFEGSRERQQPTLALVLVIDKSGSMSSEDKLDLVKEAARATARALDPSDELGVIAFDSAPHVLVRLQPAANRIRIASDIRRLAAGGGTNAVPALREAYLQLAGSRALVKHVILLSDGESPERGIGTLLADMNDADITVSTVGVGAGAGRDFLARVARGGGGRFYYSRDATDVPRIFSRETREVTRNAVRERAFTVSVAKPAEVLRGLDFANAPPLLGLVPLKAKARAEVLLSAGAGEPLLVRGRFGLGRTYAFASDAMPRWAARWVAWSGFPKFWSHVVRDAMRRRGDLAGGADVRIEPAGGHRVQVTVDVEATADGYPNHLVGEVTVEGAGEPRRAPLALAAPGRYAATVEVPPTGALLFRARLFDPERGRARPWAEALGRRVVPYPGEFDLRAERPTDRARLAALAAGGVLDGPVAPAVSDPPAPDRRRTRRAPLWPYVLAFVLLPLLLLDLAARRLVVPRPAADPFGGA